MKYVSPQIYIYLQSVQAYIAPPIAACFLLGVLYPRLNGTGALAALWTGLVLGTTRLVLELGRSHLASGTVWVWFATINFLHFAALLFALCAGILIAVSLVTAPPAPARIAGVTYGAPEITAIPVPAGPRSLNVVLSVVLAATIGVLWIVFR
jgi:solute:Na+ symporter, SSS family